MSCKGQLGTVASCAGKLGKDAVNISCWMDDMEGEGFGVIDATDKNEVVGLLMNISIQH